MKRAVLYLRLSKEDVDKDNKLSESESIINQRLLLTDYVLEQGWMIVDTYVDEDYSGLYDDRPEFDRLIRDSKLGKFDVIVCKTQSRFTRNMEHVEKYIHHDFLLLGIRFIGVVDGIDTDVDGNKKTRQIRGLTDEWYCEDLSKNIKDTYRKKMEKGQFLGGFAPYGYLKDPKDKHKFIMDEYAAGVVRRIYQMYLEGYGICQICFALEDDGILNPTRYKHQQGLSYANVKADEFSVKYGFWSMTTVKRILSNETYIGKLQQGRFSKPSYKDRKVVSVPREQWVEVENHHEAIITQEIFDRVQKQMKSRRGKTNERGKVHKLAGKIKCADCGSTIIRTGCMEKDGKKDWYMRCQLANKSRNRECTSHLIRYSAVETAVLKSIRQLVHAALSDMDNKDKISRVLEEMSGSRRRLNECRKKLESCREAKEKIMQKLALLYDDRVKGTVSEDMFLHIKKSFDRELIHKEESIKELDREIASMEKEESEKKSKEELLDKYCDYSELTYEMVTDFIDYIEVGEKEPVTKKQEITIHWNL